MYWSTNFRGTSFALLSVLCMISPYLNNSAISTSSCYYIPVAYSLFSFSPTLLLLYFILVWSCIHTNAQTGTYIHILAHTYLNTGTLSLSVYFYFYPSQSRFTLSPFTTLSITISFISILLPFITPHPFPLTTSIFLLPNNLFKPRFIPAYVSERTVFFVFFITFINVFLILYEIFSISDKSS